MKRWVFLITFLLTIPLLIIPFTSAGIQLVEENKNVYNLNMEYLLDAYVSNAQGFLKATLYCNSYTLDYFILPVDIIDQQSIDIPNLKIDDLMLGQCYVEVSLINSNKNLIEWEDSKRFTVTDDLLINLVLDKNTLLPGERVNVNGIVKYLNEDNVDPFKYNIFFDGTEFEDLEGNNGEFGYMFDLGKTIKTGEHTIKVEAYDNYGNNGEKSAKLYVQAVPTQLKNWINRLEFLPGERVEVKALLYDQAYDLIDDYVTIKIFNKNNEILNKDVRTEEIIFLDLDEQALPGEWRIETEGMGLEIESKFNVLSVKNLDISLSEYKVIIKNIGNVNFDGNVIVYLNDFSFTKRIKLDVNEIKEIDLKGKVKGGNYNVKVYANNKEFDLGNIRVVDDRNLLEKTGDLITGNVVAVGVGDFFSNYIAYFIVVVILIIVFIIWQNKKRKNVNRRREKEIIEGQLKMKNIKGERETIKNKPSKGMFSSAKNIDEKEAKEFREQILKTSDEDKKEKKDSWFE